MNNIEKLLRQRDEIEIINNGITKPKAIYFKLLDKGHGISKRQLRRDLKEIGKVIPDAQRNSNMQKIIRFNEKPIIKLNQLLKETENIQDIETRIKLQNDLQKTIILANKQQLVVFDRLSIIPTREEIVNFRKDKELLNKFKLAQIDILNLTNSEMELNKNFKQEMYKMIGDNKLYKKLENRDGKNNILKPSEMDNYEYSLEMNTMNIHKDHLLHIRKKYDAIDSLLDQIILSVRTYQINEVNNPVWDKSLLLLKDLFENKFAEVKAEIDFEHTIPYKYKLQLSNHFVSEESKKRINRIIDEGFIDFLLKPLYEDIEYYQRELAKSDEELIAEYEEDKDDEDYESVNVDEFRRDYAEMLRCAIEIRNHLEQIKDCEE